MGLSVNNRWMANFIASRRWLRRTNMFQLPKSSYVLYKSKKVFVDLNDSEGPSYQVLSWGVDTYEPENVALLGRFCNPKGPTVMLDIGANIGVFSLKMALNTPALKVFASESDLDASSCLQQSIQDNGIANVQTLNFDPQGETIDNLVTSGKIPRLDLLRLDLQRQEDKVLEGAKQTLKKFRPIVLMKCYFEDLDKAGSPLLKIFNDIGGYVFFEPKSKLLRPIKAYSRNSFPPQNLPYCDLLFVPEEKWH